MKIAISTIGRFHLFNLAEQLERRGALSQLITSPPKFVVLKYNKIPKEKITSLFLKEALQRSWEKFPPVFHQHFNLQPFFHRVFDKQSARALRPADILVSLPSSFVYTQQRAKEFNMITVLEQGSSHTLFQKEILEEEYYKFNITPGLFSAFPQKIIENDLKAYQKADFIAVPSFFVKRTFIEKGVPESKLLHIPYGVNLSAFHQIPKEDKIFRVVFAGGMCLRKGVHYLLQAFAELNLPNSELILLGAMNEEMKFFFKKYEGKFNYVGKVPQAELYRWYSQGSVFVMPSLEEGLAMVQPQAMACGLPIIATTNTGAEDIVRDGKDGFIIPIRDVEKLKEKIQYFYNHEDERFAMGQSAKERVSSGFTWDDYGARVFSEYQRILNKNYA